MKITDLLLKNIMIMDLKSTRKEAAIDEMIASLAAQNRIGDIALFKQGILDREAQTSTGLGDGIAMPHAKNAAVNEATVLFAKSSNGIDYEALDGQPTHLFFMIAAPEGANDTHLQALASLARLLVSPEFVASLRNANTPEEVHSLFENAEKERLEKEHEEQKDQETPKQDTSRPFVIAVTACPTGIAHTYMAEDALKKKAAEMNIDIKVETNGTEGVKNRLSANDIKRAAGVIIAADKNVEMNRFDGKHLLQRPVSDGIRKPAELIEKAMNKQAPIYYANDSGNSNREDNEGGSVLSKVYKDLMNGISHMLPFVVGGGILLALSFLVEPYFGDKSEIFIFLNSLGGNAFRFLIPILAGYIAMSIGDRPGLMPGMVGGFMAVESNAGFLGGLAAGFIAGYSILLLRRVLKGIPKSLEGLKSILLYPVLSLLIIGFLMYFIVDPVFSTINTAMINFLENLGTGNAVLLGALLGGMMAIDMGGPFNKAAYTFSIGIFTDTGDGSLMAAVMAGGMIPPLAIALASTLFKNKFTADERKSGLTNYILGLSFITEGAIPFAAADPLRVITSSVVGAAIAGGLTQFWNISIPAPHGGIFAIGLSNHALLFLVTLAIGMVISALILGFWKKTITEELS
ncbi:PTS system D-fructose-specific IIA component (F1P-forming), Frc family /PTS system D-fructose-specific IIB component (F1P-forming), Frc family /PTS system D-fructose-specific IIC component (F1P-forming), Frc family [Carnobacterium iners]|uniref:PTS system D-fructose-specific IIA component (F1P-forming), Frc family /PTS system D-fructose-specific IIB component (F1P-forming), Frc family /PTS system D-fructose-specific IIC component (F1P-for... n=1 Tax=Carnobacterium iners TaxID=1073423 RepID=A0A1X7NHM3_9LACT|nr:fructose-specific PTS transporter subunit EIIC [Carnobacterium iners]SEK64273.1 PTS system D-fructose-specific IIA component (F1P-forming), Frc family /PTS system D-fructose-specific IIB component (F1P-forming), Frc family /PTS system D-fructose-specific IIC component (F1P-forming), Frc family [Carnobacterium iners]SMH37269.1 PTS system D-fructose-specific IIA component (F1P-forming), Frc family /PTS system D-fructose-specific IIB component (F1P-forming), Frc family /PTS system D-fructose-spec